MAIRKLFSRDPQLAVGPAAASPSRAIEIGLGASIGAVLAGVVGGAFFGPAGTVSGMALGGVVGAALGGAVARYVDHAHEDAYWRERPYVDTAFGFHDRDLGVDHPAAPLHATQPATLEEVAANPRVVHHPASGRGGAGMHRNAHRMPAPPLSLGELAAQGK